MARLGFLIKSCWVTGKTGACAGSLLARDPLMDGLPEGPMSAYRIRSTVFSWLRQRLRPGRMARLFLMVTIAVVTVSIALMAFLLAIKLERGFFGRVSRISNISENPIVAK
jgi:hypothetical protein